MSNYDESEISVGNNSVLSNSPNDDTAEILVNLSNKQCNMFKKILKCDDGYLKFNSNDIESINLFLATRCRASKVFSTSTMHSTVFKSLLVHQFGILEVLQFSLNYKEKIKLLGFSNRYKNM